MNRRTFIVTTAGLLAAPLAGAAQQAAKVPRIGWLGGGPGPRPHLREAFLQELRELGYAEGRNLVIEYRHAEAQGWSGSRLSRPNWLPSSVDVIVASAGNIRRPGCQAGDSGHSHCLRWRSRSRLRAASSPASRTATQDPGGQDQATGPPGALLGRTHPARGGQLGLDQRPDPGVVVAVAEAIFSFQFSAGVPSSLRWEAK